MTKTYARVIDGVVVNVELWGETPPAEAGVTFVETATAARGWTWDGETLSPGETEPTPRRLIPKSTVTARLIDAGLMDEADAILNSNKAYLYRWFTPDWPNVYADDEALLAVLDAIGADIEAITAP